MSDTTAAQDLRDIAAAKNKQRTYEELSKYIMDMVRLAASDGLYSVTLSFEELNAPQGTIEEWQRICKQPINMLNVVIQTQDEKNKELVIKWG